METMIKTAFTFIMMIIVQYLLLFFTFEVIFDNYDVAVQFTNRLAQEPIVLFIWIIIGIFASKSESI